MKEHIKWVDCVKVEACILVVMGHFYQSMVVSGILPDNTIYNWFINTIYCFHVQLFFICSGFLYQKYSKVNNMSTWIKNIKKKLLSLGIPYLIFTTATWMLKHVFSGAVNNGLQTGLAETIFLKPTAPYWYLYALFFIFLITPTFSNTKIAVCYLIGAIIGKFFFLSGGGRYGIYALSVVLQDEVWFVSGMVLCIFSVNVSNKAKKGVAVGIVFLAMSGLLLRGEVPNLTSSFLLGVLACASVILMTKAYQDNLAESCVFKFMSKYTMPVFLMHTICAAPTRSILFKIGITSAWIHIPIGLAVSFGGPILVAIVLKKMKYAEFILYPGKFVRF